MNKQLNLAVAAAVLAFSASANAGITIPAGDWTVDIGGNMNAFYTHTSTDRTTAAGTTSQPESNGVGTGLLPSAFGIGAKSRQNDLDVAFQFSFFTGTSASNSSGGAAGSAAAGNTLNIRQAFLSFGDASWGTIKLGRDLGVFGSDAILSDMTLLGVGVSIGQAGSGGSSTLGRIGSGYIYADWAGQIQYASPNWNGFSFTAAIVEPLTNGSATTTREDMGYEGKVDYDFAVSDVTGRVWLGGITQEHSNTVAGSSYTSRGFDIGAKAAAYGFGLVGYYYDGEGLDSQNLSITTGGLKFLGGSKTDDNGGYVQATYTIPGIGTKLGASWGTSNSKSPVAGGYDIENKSWILGAYHPLTKSLNLVAEYTNQEIEDSSALTSIGIAGITGVKKIESDTIALGAIMFF
jgi:predicted porin